MTILISIGIGLSAMFLVYELGKIKGIDEYHEHLLREGKITEIKRSER